MFNLDVPKIVGGAALVIGGWWYGSRLLREYQGGSAAGSRVQGDCEIPLIERVGNWELLPGMDNLLGVNSLLNSQIPLPEKPVYFKENHKRARIVRTDDFPIYYNGEQVMYVSGAPLMIAALVRGLSASGATSLTHAGTWGDENHAKSGSHAQGLAIDIPDLEGGRSLIHALQGLGYRFRFGSMADGGWYWVHRVNGVNVIQWKHDAGPGHLDHHWHLEFTSWT